MSLRFIFFNIINICCIILVNLTTNIFLNIIITYYYNQTTVYEVTLDANGVARRCPTGKGTHFIHVNQDYETHLEEKVYI